MTITAKIIADSVSPDGIRLTTMQLRYPRFVHAEFMTHRVFSRNASSSRAIPVERLIEDIQRDTAMPIHWGKNQPGMQAHEEHEALIELSRNWYPKKTHFTAKEAWIDARDRAICNARAFHRAGYHKQIVNRLLEPFSHINVVVTATEWKNFFALRRHKDAQPEIRMLAELMWLAMEESRAMQLEPGAWHLPYVGDLEIQTLNPVGLIPINWETLIKLSVARCARTSYLTHDGKEPDILKDLELYDRLVGSVPLHASPAEHQATPDRPYPHVENGWYHQHQHGNLHGWIQYRKTLLGENQA